MGFASPANEELADTITVADYLIRDKDASYILTVEGSSMHDAGLLEGDLVVFERSGNYKPGNIVVALTEGGYAVRYLRKKGSIYYLESADPNQLAYYPHEGEIIGVVTGSFRSYV